ncbi:carboxypeptidase regulatory-like domain-containing protein [Lyngbya sp. CCY1209]|uniref:carboxypeptidase regulatory-like domain-containing protein n=1 Tax=Lyngbya sp. CCY1209 TaxID=2886103 RepID=UPI002D210BC6|nr:carboxypeptidase regulatory-like domain-containing protein [Lyngbya sp. CCY1209]MEB3887447.1 carboxypeptidase-like regulatory domain-containing protein [Lyngbya sp. CCY1209]
MRWKYALPLLLFSAAGIPERAIAHGANIEYQKTSAVEIEARYDSGTPMADAQVSVYSPDNPAEPWKTGLTDSRGRFVFIPDPDKSGLWEVKVRQAGHGDLIAVPVGPAAGAEAAGDTRSRTDAIAPNSSLQSNSLQTWVTAAAVIWGFVGTALFFSRFKPAPSKPGETRSVRSQESEG